MHKLNLALGTWHSFGSYKSEAKVAKFNADVARMNNVAKGKGIKHDSTKIILTIYYKRC